MSEQNATAAWSRSRKASAWSWTGVALVVTWLLGVALRGHRLETLFVGAETPFFIESAMRFRVLQYFAEGHYPPALDFQMLWPDGYPPDGDTIFQEFFFGTLAHWLKPPNLETFVRESARWVYCLIVLPLFWWGYEATGKRSAALLGVLMYVTLPSSLDRSTGLVLYRENLCQPLLAMHLASLFVAFRRPKQPGWLAVSGVFLLICHLTWKVMTFYQLFLQLFLLVLCVIKPPDRTLRLSIYWLTLPVLVTSLIPDLPLAGCLRFDRYWGSSNAAMTLALCTLALVYGWREKKANDSREPQAPEVEAVSVTSDAATGPSPVTRRFTLDLNGLDWRGALVRGAVLVALLGLFVLLLPGGQSYSHAWNTVFAKIRYLGVKPDDPGLLDISSRHYWTGNYRSPTLARAVRDFSFPLLMSVMLIRRRYTLSLRDGRQRAWWLVLAGLLGFSVGYLMFRKFGTFLGLFLIPTAALGAQTVFELARHRQWLARAMLVGLMGVSYLSGWNNLGAEQVFQDAHDTDPAPGEVYPVSSLNALSQWLKRETPPKAPLLASWALSPFLHTYLDKSTILNSYFESPQVFRSEEFYRRLFMPLPELHAFARQYRADYLILEAHMLLRTDKWMSFRYVADRLTLQGNEACYRLHYQPEDTPGFALVYQNEWFRVYQVLPDATERRAVPPGLPYAPLFDPRVPGAQVGQPLDVGSKLLYGSLEAGRLVTLGDAQREAGHRDEALQSYLRAVQTGPWLPAGYLRLIALAQQEDRTSELQILNVLLRQHFHGAVVPPTQP